MNWNEKDCKIVYIYVLLNKADRVAYVGQTANPDRRKKNISKNLLHQKLQKILKSLEKVLLSLK